MQNLDFCFCGSSKPAHKYVCDACFFRQLDEMDMEYRLTKAEPVHMVGEGETCECGLPKVAHFEMCDECFKELD